METNVSGDKSLFAVEFSEISYQGQATFSQCGIWLGGHRLYDPWGTTCLDALLRRLQGIANLPPITGNPSPVPASATELRRMITSEEADEIRWYSCFEEETFDYFLKLFTKDQRHMTFIWTIDPDYAGFDIFRDYPKGVQKVCVENSEFQRVVDEFAQAVKMTKQALAESEGSPRTLEAG